MTLALESSKDSTVCDGLSNTLMRGKAGDVLPRIVTDVKELLGSETN